MSLIFDCCRINHLEEQLHDQKTATADHVEEHSSKYKHALVRFLYCEIFLRLDSGYLLDFVVWGGGGGGNC